MRLRRAVPARHVHDFRPKALNHLEWERGYPETIILRVCACGRRYTEKLDGMWTWKDLELVKDEVGERDDGDE